MHHPLWRVDISAVLQLASRLPHLMVGVVQVYRSRSKVTRLTASRRRLRYEQSRRLRLAVKRRNVLPLSGSGIHALRLAANQTRVSHLSQGRSPCLGQDLSFFFSSSQ